MLASRLGLVQTKKVPFTVSSKDGTKLSALLEIKQPNSKECVLIVHGGLDNKKAPIIRALCDQLPFNTVSFDFRGMGDSEGKTKQSGFKEEADDMESVIDAVNKQHKLKVVAVVAHSRGGTTSTFYFSRKPSANTPKHLVLINPSFATPPKAKETVEAYERVAKTGKPEVLSKYRNRGKLTDYILTIEDIEFRKTLDMESLVQAYPPDLKTMIVAGSADEILGTADSEAYDKILKKHPGHRYCLLEGLGHYFRAPEEQEQLVREVRRWLNDVNAISADKTSGVGTVGGKIKIKL